MIHKPAPPDLQRQINIDGARNALLAIEAVVAGAPAAPRARTAEEVDADGYRDFLRQLDAINATVDNKAVAVEELVLAKRALAWVSFARTLALPPATGDARGALAHANAVCRAVGQLDSFGRFSMAGTLAEAHGIIKASIAVIRANDSGGLHALGR